MDKDKDREERLRRRLRELTAEVERKTQVVKRLSMGMVAPVAPAAAATTMPLFPAIGHLAHADDDDDDDDEAAHPPQSGEAEAEDEAEHDEEFERTGLRTTALGVTEIKSLCMACHETGTTRLLLTSIPFFREVILSSFSCPYCHYRDTEIQSGGAVQEKGTRYTLTALGPDDLSKRQIVKSETARVLIPALDLEIPPQRGLITTLEGILRDAYEGLTTSNEQRAQVDPEAALKIAAFAQKLLALLEGESFPFDVIIEDVAGNSFVESFRAPAMDPNLREFKFVRSPEQQAALGLAPAATSRASGAALSAPPKKLGSLFKRGGKANAKAAADGTTTTTSMTLVDDDSNARRARELLEEQDNDVKGEILRFAVPCPACQADGHAESCVVNLPFFKEVIIMAFTCDVCGFKDTEIKGGGAIPDKGRRDTLRVESPEDLTRDVIKSDTAGVHLPELEIEVTRGSMGGMYSSVEGILMKIRDDLFQTGSSFFTGDALGDPETRARFQEIEEKMEQMLAGKLPFTFVVEDPLANSYIYSPEEDPSQDRKLSVETYTRTWEEDDELGLHDMQVDQDAAALPPISAFDESESAEERMRRLQKDKPDTHPFPAFAAGHGNGDHEGGGASAPSS